MSRNLIDLISSMEKAAQDSKPETISGMTEFQRQLTIKGLEGKEHEKIMVIENTSELTLATGQQQLLVCGKTGKGYSIKVRAGEHILIDRPGNIGD